MQRRQILGRSPHSRPTGRGEAGPRASPAAGHHPGGAAPGGTTDFTARLITEPLEPSRASR
jgi:hypothetical protein